MSGARVRRVAAGRPVSAVTLTATMTTLAPEPCSLPSVPRPRDAEQAFVARLRAAAVPFAAAAGAQGAVVREAVPPARHRRSRCRVVLRFADRPDVDVAFLGPAGQAGRAADLAGAIGGWLSAGRPMDPAWLVPDADAPDGVTVDLPAWSAAG